MNGNGRPRVAVSWSGGKDSCLAYCRVRERCDVVAFLTMLTEDGSRSRSHGLRPELLRTQAKAAGVDIVFGRASWTNYEQEFIRILGVLKARAVECIVFGDIFLDDHKRWVERVCACQGLQATEPLWGEPTNSLAREFLQRGGHATLVAVQCSRLDGEWLGRELDEMVLNEFANIGIDPCGEFGEYHTFVSRIPGEPSSIIVRPAGSYEFSGYAALDLELSGCAPKKTREVARPFSEI